MSHTVVNSMINVEKFKYYKMQCRVMHQDVYGFLGTCDSLLFTGLLGTVPGTNIDLLHARDSKGAWHRRPMVYGCYPHQSKSTISRDMLLGVLYWAYYNKRCDVVDDLIDYSFKHFMVMGKGPLSRTLMSPSLLSTAAWISYRLGGPSRKWLRAIPYMGGEKLTGFEAHLQVLHLLLRKQLKTDDCYKYQRRWINYHLNRCPTNPLFLHAAGFNALAMDELDNPKLWPVDRLPTTRNRKEPWLFQRDTDTDDWKPAVKGTPVETHSGADYLFLVSMILRDIEQNS